MIPKTPSHTSASSVAGRFIQQTLELTESIEQALSAFSRHSLAGIEECLWTQERLSALIQRTAQELRFATINQEDAWAIRSALTRLGTANRCYENVVREATCTNAILRAALDKSYPRHTISPSASYGSLSFEV